MPCSLPFAWQPDRQVQGVSNLSFSCELMLYEQAVGRQKGSADSSPLRPK